GLSRASTSWPQVIKEDVMAGTSPAMKQVARRSFASNIRSLLRHPRLAQPALEPQVKSHERGIVVGQIVPLRERSGAGALQRAVLSQRRASFCIAPRQCKFGGL